MNALPRKAKQYLVFTAKLLVVGGAIYFIYSRLANDRQLSWGQLIKALQGHNAWVYATVILILTFLNRFLEVLKWQSLASTLQPISLGRAASQVLAAVTAALFTPNGIGEYAAKALYYKKAQAGQVLFLNLVCNGVQLIIAVLAGLTGLIIFNSLYHVIPVLLLIIILFGLVAIITVVVLSRNITIKGYSLHRLFAKVNELPKAVHRKNLLLATGRYLSIVLQHYFIFALFGVQLPFYILMPAIAGVYFLGSSLPNFQFIDFAVRGSVAVFFFGLMGVNEWMVVLAATLQWLLNIVLPVSIGSYFVLTFKRLQADTA